MTFESEWARCAPWLQDALDHAGNTHALSDVLDLVMRGEATFWPAPNAAAVTEVLAHPRVTILHVWLAGGALSEIEGVMLDRAEAWGRERGCTRMTMAGRPGFERVLAKHGFAPVARVCSKELA